MGKNNKGANKGAIQNAAPAVAKTEKEKEVVAPAAEPAKAPAAKVQESKQPKKPAVDAAAKAEIVPTVATEDANDHMIQLSAKSSKTVANAAKSMSADSKVGLATLMQKRYIDNPEAPLKYSQAFINEADNLIDNIALLAILDLREDCIERGLDLTAEFNGNRVFQVTEACKMLGITLPKPKLLESGQAELNFTDAKVDANIEEAVKQDRKAKKRIADKVPELDPSKITTNEEVIAALEYLLRSNSNGIKGLIATADFLRDHLIFKTTKPEEKAELKAKTIGEWLEEILKLVKPTLLLTGIGRNIYVNVAQDGNPLAGHALTHNQVLDEKRIPLLTEVQIADVITTLLRHNAMFTLKNEPEEMKGKSIADDRAIQALLQGSGALIDKIMSQAEAVDKKAYNMIKNAYFPAGVSYVNLEDQMRTKLGQILNLYLPIAERMEQFPEIVEGEYPITVDATAEATAEDKPTEEKKN